MTEGRDPDLGYAWGCNFDQKRGWVPFPNKVPRRHPLTYAVNRTDDPCNNPKREQPDNKPVPKFKILQQGVPNAVCNLDDYEEERNPLPDSILARGDIIPDKTDDVQFRLKPILNTTLEEPKPEPIEECCAEARSLDLLKEKVGKLIGPEPKNYWDIDENKPKTECLDQSCACKNNNKLGSDNSFRPPKERKCTLYVPRKNVYRPPPDEPFDCNKWVDWFEGYGSEKNIHPFYLTTSSNYGRFGPNPHSMTTSLYGMERKFTRNMGCVGRPRNRALNLSSDKSKV